MKSIEELGISPTPWHNYGPDCEVYDSKQVPLTDEFGFHRNPNDRWFIAAAPELYEALRLACGSCIDCDKDCTDCINFNRSWMPAARAALAKAGGAE